MPKFFTFLLVFISLQTFAGFEDVEKVEIEELTFKEIIRNLYQGQFIQGKITELDYDEVDDFSLYDEIQKRKDIENSTLLKKPKKLEKLKDNQMLSQQELYGAYLGGVRKYYNANKEERYLVAIGIVGLDENWGIIEWRNVLSLLDLYIFKKQNNKFQLVSRTHENIETMLRMHSLLSELFEYNSENKMYKNSTVKLGKNSVGIFSDSSISLGVGDPWSHGWDITRLNENDYITIEYIKGGAEDTFQDESSPTHFAYEANYSIHDDNSANFPIFVHYKGDIPQYNTKGEFVTVKKSDYIIKWIFNNKKGYVESSTTK